MQKLLKIVSEREKKTATNKTSQTATATDKAKPASTADLSFDKKDWSRSDCLQYFKNEPTLHQDLIDTGYKTKRSEAGYWCVQSAEKKKNISGHTFVAGSSRLKTKSIPHHLNAPAN